MRRIPILLIASCLAMTAGGVMATIAIAGSGDDNQVATGQSSQQALGSQSRTPQAEVLPQQETGAPTDGLLPDDAAVENAPTAEVQQVAAAQNDEQSLPFTGFVAATALLMGLALLGTGLVLRRRSHAPVAG
jgi:hypothetical protein